MGFVPNLSEDLVMISDRKESDSLVEKLLKVYEHSCGAEFSEVKHQLAALQWVSRMMDEITKNELRAKSGD